MSIDIQHLTKIYGTQKAVDDVSFEIPKGEVVGFLGPNGAGKSTTMKILSCFIPPTEGIAKVCGYDVTTHPIEARKKIGYLPEHNPLYLDMYVREYLGFVAGIYKLKNITQRVSEMVGLTGLTPESHKKIGALSKGYRQRVGLAQAMIHDPEVLILDEPTSGLDPNQLVGIRQLIQDIGKEKTVMLSTHIMQEVQAICNRVIIIDSGKIVADDQPDQLQQQKIKSEVVITVEFEQVVEKEILSTLPGITTLKNSKGNVWHIIADRDIRSAISKFAIEKELGILTIQKETDNLETIFRKLTSK